jgi:hypothetical protein
LAPIPSYTYDKAGWLTGTVTGAVASSSAARPWNADQEAMADAVLGQARKRFVDWLALGVTDWKGLGAYRDGRRVSPRAGRSW